MREGAVSTWRLGSVTGATAAAATAEDSPLQTQAFLWSSRCSALPRWSGGRPAMPHAGGAGTYLWHKGSCSTCAPMQPHAHLNLRQTSK